MLLFIEL